MIAGIVVAAGASRRMGRVKQLLPLGGRPLLSWALEAMRAFAPNKTVLVLGHEAERIMGALNLRDIQVVLNPRFADGLSTSLQAGLQALGANVQSAVIVTGDQPLITCTHLQALAAAHTATGLPLVATDYGDHLGVPLLLHRQLWPLAYALHGDQGARPLIQEHRELVARVSAASPLMSLDVDTEESYSRVQEALASSDILKENGSVAGRL